MEASWRKAMKILEVHLRSIYLWVVKKGQTAAEQQVETEENSEIDLTGCHILLAEDHPLNVMVATSFWSIKGC